MFDEVGLFIIELFVVLPVGVELGQKVHKLVLVPDQDVQDRFRLVWVGNKYLERKLDVDYFMTAPPCQDLRDIMGAI